jgi:hypothetical protein
MPHSTQKAKLAVWIPILVAIASLAFNIFQYVDKRALEKKIHEEEIRQKQVDISIDYIVTDFQSIQEWIDRGKKFDEALLNWLRFLEEALPFETSLHLIENTVYAEIKSYAETKSHDEDITNHDLTFLLLRNAGKSNAENIRIGFSDREQEHPLVIPRIEPGYGVMAPIEHYDNQKNKHFGTRLIPATRLTYFDTLLDEDKEEEVRWKADQARILAPTIRLKRGIDFHFIGWFLILGASVVLFFWVARKIMTVRRQS